MMPSVTQTYPKIAWMSGITPASDEHYQNLIQAGIKTVSVCLHVSGYQHDNFSVIHTNTARRYGLVTHAHMVTDLYHPEDDVDTFERRFRTLDFCDTTKITLWINGDKYLPDREDRITKIVNLLSNSHDQKNIDLAFFKRDLDDELYDLEKLPDVPNLTIINLTENAIEAGVPDAGTWIYSSKLGDEIQVTAYDYYGYYTDHSYQLSLVDTDYTVQPGDTWHTIARRHGVPTLDLLMINHASIDTKIYAGQVIRVA